MGKPLSNHCPCCTAPIAMDKLMCRTHWGLVPPAMQRAVYATWRNANGSKDGSTNARLMAVRDYQRARDDAIRAVRQAIAAKGPQPTNGAPT